VVFSPVETKVNDPVQYRGVSDEEGHYELRRAEDDRIGAGSGEYIVTLTTAVPKPADNETTPLPPERVPRKYRDGTLRFTVPEGGTNEANFEMKIR